MASPYRPKPWLRRLTSTQARQVLRRLRHRESDASIAASFDVSEDVVRAIRVGETYREIRRPPLPKPNRHRLSPEEAQALLRSLEENPGLSYLAAGKAYGVSYGVVSALVHGRSTLKVKKRRTKAMRRKTGARGEAHGFAVLTASDVVRIRRLFDAKERTVSQLAKEYRWDVANMWRICRRRSWQSVP